MRFYFLFFLIAIIQLASAQPKLSPQAEAYLMKEALVKYHINPVAINDSFSEEVFRAFFETIDPDRIYFTEVDIETLRNNSATIDDELNGKQWLFMSEFIPAYKRVLQRAVQILETLSKESIPQHEYDTFTYDTLHWPADERALQIKWKKWYRLQVLGRLADMYVREENPAVDFYMEREPEARMRVRAQQLRAINRIRQNPSGFEQYIHTVFFQVICSLFDPHSAYLSKTELENMLSSLSTEGYYFGVSLDENKRGDVIIAALIPGSPAWKSGELQPADVVLALRWKGQQEVDLIGLSSDEANEILSDANHQELEFVVQKANGAIRKVKLKKEKLTVEENLVRSFLLKGKRTVGYVSLPDFYTQWGDESEGSRCAADVANEIRKLQASHIEGLILDLRGNSGGSMQEALAMAGIFIDEGPLGITRDRQGTVTVLRDLNRGTVYDGPLVILVNGMSASASELLAGVLQDYNRGVVVGETTYGKGSMQNFFPIHVGFTDVDYSKINGSMLKITTDKFYRVTGKSIQSKGIRPDIHLPDMFEAVNYNDAILTHALPADSVFKNTYFKPLPVIPVGALKSKSEGRIHGQVAFDQLEKWTLWLKKIIKEEKQPVIISWPVMLEKAIEETQMYQRLDMAMEQQPAPFEVMINPGDRQRDDQEYYQTFNRQ